MPVETVSEETRQVVHAGLSEHRARRIMAQAMLEDRCSELLRVVFEGGMATIHQEDGSLVLLEAEALDQ